MNEVRVKESSLQDIADAIREKTGETGSYYPADMADAIGRIQVTEMVIEPLQITANGEYKAPEGVNGYDPVTVDVQPVIEELTITANGDYEVPEGVHGFNPVSVNVPPDVKAIDITENGTYTATDCDGYNEITVGVYPETEELNVTENGEYNPDTYGYSKVTVDVQPELEDITITDNGTYKSDKYGYGEIIVNCPPPPTDEDLTITGTASHRFAWNGWNWVIDKYRDRITTKDITACSNMFFYATKLEELPFQINIKDCENFSYMFNNCEKLQVCPKIRGTVKWSTSTDFSSTFLSSARMLRNVDDLLTPEMIDGFSTIKVTSAYSCPKTATFYSCYSLRKLPEWWYKFKLNPESTAYPTYSYSIYYQGFNACYALDEVTNIPVWKCSGAQTTNMFNNTFNGTYRLKAITFETNPDGTPIEVNWKSQTIDIPNTVGNIQPGNGTNALTIYNSGITTDKEVKDDATYQALKNDPDWYTRIQTYSRYNHDSAVATINSLPDTSAYLATAGGTNTIKFQGKAGEKTDGGAINTMTAEEIAVATAKGWTVTLS